MGKKQRRRKKKKAPLNEQRRAVRAGQLPNANGEEGDMNSDAATAVGENKTSEKSSRPQSDTQERDAQERDAQLIKNLDEKRQKLNTLEKELDKKSTELGSKEKKLSKREENLNNQEKELQVKRDELKKEDSRLAQMEKNLSERSSRQDDRHKKLKEHQKALDKREVELNSKEADLQQRELNAEQGFAEERRAMLTEFESARDELRDERRALEEEIEQRREQADQEDLATQRRRAKKAQQERDALQAELEKRRDKVNEKLEEKRDQWAKCCRKEEDALLAERTQLEEDKRAVVKRERAVKFEKEELDELHDHLEEHAERLSSKRIEELEHELEDSKKRLKQARENRDRHAETIRQREEADRRFGQRTPEQVLEELDRLRTERNELQAELDRRLSSDNQAQLESLLQERQSWHQRRAELTRENAELQRQVAYGRQEALERETHRDLIASLMSQRDLLQEANHQTRAEIDDLLSQSEASSAFPACRDMDEDETLQTPPPSMSRRVDLEEFVEDLRHRIATTHDDRQLFYTLPDLRAFIGGLAMGRLLLLQGISGTGKTSLPLAFARAVGGEATVIEVQAGWRDPQDLIGHYNNFEKRYYEKEFLQALYRAQTPQRQDMVHIILLDEMNLSHPEQYFSDMLSTLELPTEEQRLTIMPHAVQSPPSLFRDGRFLSVPENVWFVGTANHDETTKDFADKTYDRSHIMEFPHRPEPFDVTQTSLRDPISFKALRSSFDQAIKAHSDVADRAIEILNTHLRDPLTENFGVGWGPRLERQIGRYVPVVKAAGGSPGEALDHVVSTRLIRKLRHRHDNRPEQLQELRDTISLVWEEKLTEAPVKSVRMLNGELRRLGVEVEE